MVFNKGDSENPVKEEYITCVSDFLRVPDERSKTVRINLKDFIGENGLKKGEKYTVSITAFETFGKSREAKTAEIIL